MGRGASILNTNEPSRDRVKQEDARVLVVEDNPASSALAARLLT
jgi:hypothetical protein